MGATRLMSSAPPIIGGKGPQVGGQPVRPSGTAREN